MTKLRHKRPDGTWCPYNPLPPINGIYLCEKCGKVWTLEDLTRSVQHLSDTFKQLGASMSSTVHLPEPYCTGCSTPGHQLPEYITMATEEANFDDDEFASAEWATVDPETVNDWIRREEGTYNHQNGHFLCTPCYIRAGQPSSPRGWTAP